VKESPKNSIIGLYYLRWFFYLSKGKLAGLKIISRNTSKKAGGAEGEKNTNPG